ncbi:MAG: VacJ family lipoprotein [Rhodocyclaceae bacterium]|nr:VacJ family lipoprotein [Rhodocyclaceae bacterium]
MGRFAAPILVAALAVGGCASTPDNPDDPLEGYNRAMFDFNDRLDKAVLKPTAQVYDKFTPLPVRAGVGNFFGNIGDVWIGINNILQGKAADGMSDLARVLINSTVGILGIFDIATEFGFERHDEDFGQTLGSWGVGEGAYFVLPVLGPRTVRDAGATVVDMTVDNAWYGGQMVTETGTTILKLVNTRANLLAADKVLDEGALDRYVYVREAYLQRRRYEVHDGRPPRDPEDDYWSSDSGETGPSEVGDAMPATGSGEGGKLVRADANGR